MTDAKQILIIEDEATLAHALELKLAGAGYIVTIAPSGEEGLNALKTQKFDVALLDLLMPVVDGYKILKSLQDMPDAPATYVLTNLSQPEDKAKALALGAKDFFVKSEMTLGEIIEAIKKDEAASGEKVGEITHRHL